MDWLLFVRIAGFLHLLTYVGIMWYGWKSYRILRKKSWMVMGIGFMTLLLYRGELFYGLLFDGSGQTLAVSDVVIPVAGAMVLLVAFWMQSHEHKSLVRAMLNPPVRQRSGEMAPDYWIRAFTAVVRDNVKDEYLK